eukprot:5787394-Pleurochrysis_carterae.AAC.3
MSIQGCKASANARESKKVPEAARCTIGRSLAVARVPPRAAPWRACQTPSSSRGLRARQHPGGLIRGRCTHTGRGEYGQATAYC